MDLLTWTTPFRGRLDAALKDIGTTLTSQRCIPAAGEGTAYTTLHINYEREISDTLGIPFERYTQAALLPVAYHTGASFRPAERLALDSIVHWERW